MYLTLETAANSLAIAGKSIWVAAKWKFAINNALHAYATFLACRLFWFQLTVSNNRGGISLILKVLLKTENGKK